LQGVSVNQLSPSSFSFGAGLLLSFSPGLDLGFSAEDINNPNLGVVGVDRQPVLLRWGLAAKFMQHRPIQVTLTASQFLSGSDLQTQGGVECFLAQYGVKFRGGLSPYQGSVGLGFDLSDFFIDYAYSFTSFASAQLSGSSFPGSHLVEIGCQWGSTSSQVLYAENLKRAQHAESTANWEKALRWYQECLSAKSGDPEATQGRKRMLVEYNRQRAAQYYKDGQEARKQGMIFDAQNDYELASKLAPGNTDYSKALSQAAIEAERASSDKDVAEAIRQTSELIAKDDSKGALKVIFRALQRHPHNPSLELIQGSLGQEEESPAEEAKASPDVKKAKETAKLMTTEADLYLAHGQVDLAKENLEKALKANPNNTQIKIKLIRMAAPTPTVSPENQKLAQELYEKGLQNYLEGKLEDAIKDWEDALKADPLNTRVQNNLIRAKIEEKMEHP
ncbi:MAG TPA: hypothetical protein VIJ93_01070, partial [bacterium]